MVKRGSIPLLISNIINYMMAKIGKISTIQKGNPSSNVQSLENSLAQNGKTRIHGTGVYRYPYKELDNKYRTGLDPEAMYIQRIVDPVERQAEIERVGRLKEKLQKALGDIDLGPRSKFWNYGLATSQEDDLHIKSIKLLDGDNYFDLNNPFQELAFSWLRVHPAIASSYQAWEQGLYPASTQFYVVDEEIESEITYKKKSSINKAIARLESLSIEKKRKIARLLGLYVTENTKEEIVYNQIDTILKETQFKTGIYQGMNPIEVFNSFAEMKEDLLHIKDVVKQAFIHSIYRKKGNNKIYEGELEIATDEAALVLFLANDDNQEDLMVLEQKLKAKKIALI